MGNSSTCAIEGCGKKHLARGWCAMHYTRWREHGDPGVVTRGKNVGPCSVDGCVTEPASRGWCRAHYKRWANHGDPLGGAQRRATPEQSFSVRTERRDGCLIWTGSTSGDGSPYGRVWADGRMIGAHVFAYEQAYGPVPEGLVVDHRYHCSTLCCEPTHLRTATVQQNNANASGAQSGRKHDLPRNVYKLGDKYRVRVGVDRAVLSIGIYDTLEAATGAAEKARRELFGEYAGRG